MFLLKSSTLTQIHPPHLSGSVLIILPYSVISISVYIMHEMLCWFFLRDDRQFRVNTCAKESGNFSNPVSSFNSLEAASSHSSPNSSHPPGRPNKPVRTLLPIKTFSVTGQIKNTPTPILGSNQLSGYLVLS